MEPLPSELHLHIFTLIDIPTFLALRSVSHSFLALITEFELSIITSLASSRAPALRLPLPLPPANAAFFSTANMSPKPSSAGSSPSRAH